jgi:hypothetical protein
MIFEKISTFLKSNIISVKFGQGTKVIFKKKNL